MGYTHYWTPKEAAPEKWNEFVAACKKLNKSLPQTSETAGGFHKDDMIVIRGWDGTGRPLFNKNVISFNGDSGRDLDHETFHIEAKRNNWSFCKTARKPYDLLVCACLIAAHEILDFEVKSDGGLEDWQPAIDFYLDTFYDFNGEETDKDIMEAILPEFLIKEMIGE